MIENFFFELIFGVVGAGVGGLIFGTRNAAMYGFAGGAIGAYGFKMYFVNSMQQNVNNLQSALGGTNTSPNANINTQPTRQPNPIIGSGESSSAKPSMPHRKPIDVGIWRGEMISATATGMAYRW